MTTKTTMAVDKTWIIGWIIYGFVGILIVGFSGWFVSHYKLRNEPAGVTGVIGFFSLLFALLSLFLIPVDVYMCSDYDNSHYRSIAKTTYYMFYSIFLFCLFVAIPFGYFYYEELGDIEDRANTFTKKACNALKYTAVTAFLWIVLIVIGMFIDFNRKPSGSNNEWTHQISSSFSNNVDGIMPFCIAVVTAIGMFFSMIYTSYGLASFPISLMRPMTKPETLNDTKNIQFELRRVSSDLDMLYTKYRGKDNWPPKDKAKKNALERKKKLHFSRFYSNSNAKLRI